MNKPPKFKLECDSFMHGAWNEKNNTMWANYKFEIGAPANSEESSDDCDIYENSSDEIDLTDTNKPKEDPKAKFRTLDPVKLKLNNIDLKVMKDFPHKTREGDIPLKVCKVKRTDFFEKVGKKIAQYFGADDVDEYVNLKYEAMKDPAI